jgi:hypothetical protein
LTNSIVRDVVAGQQLALNYTLADLDGVVFLACMRIRAETPERLEQLTKGM